MAANTGGDGAAGASRVTADVAAVLGQLQAVIESLRGVELERLLERIPGLGGAPPSPDQLPAP